VNIVTLHAANPGPLTGAGNWTYLIPGSAPVLVDAGVGHPDHVAAVAAAAPGGLARVIVTHAHADHVSGAPVLAGRWPAATFLKHPWPGHDPATPAWQPLADGAVVDTAEGPLEVIHTPGHAPDHLALWHASSRTLFGGDLMQHGNTVAIPALNGGDLAAYLRSLKRIRGLAPGRVLPAHGRVIEDPLALIDHYLSHRLMRETQVLTALEGGLDSVEAITHRIYVGLAPPLQSLARDSVLAHLRKLQQDGLVRADADRWRLQN
jgi:glyoxylase-like metal-dependent hydrolase (beta-lactamase superfamily II)